MPEGLLKGELLGIKEASMRNQHDLLKYHEEMCNNARALMKAKNTDYARDEIFGNLDVCERVGLCSTEYGIIIRIFDKLSRLKNVLAMGEGFVKDESIEDTIVDLINYSVLMAAKQEQRKQAATHGE